MSYLCLWALILMVLENRVLMSENMSCCHLPILLDKSLRVPSYTCCVSSRMTHIVSKQVLLYRIYVSLSISIASIEMCGWLLICTHKKGHSLRNACNDKKTSLTGLVLEHFLWLQEDGWSDTDNEANNIHVHYEDTKLFLRKSLQRFITYDVLNTRQQLKEYSLAYIVYTHMQIWAWKRI